MSDSLPVPTLGRLAKFIAATSNGKRAIIREGREFAAQSRGESQVNRPAFYEPWISALLTYIRSGCRGPAMDQLVEAADQHHAPSFRANSEGAVRTLSELQPSGGKRGPRRTLLDDGGLPTIRLNSLLTLKFRDGEVMWTHAHMLTERLGGEARSLVRSALAIAVAQDASLIAPNAALWNVREGELDQLDQYIPSVREFAVVQSGVEEYRSMWRDLPE